VRESRNRGKRVAGWCGIRASVRTRTGRAIGLDLQVEKLFDGHAESACLRAEGHVAVQELGPARGMKFQVSARAE